MLEWYRTLLALRRRLADITNPDLAATEVALSDDDRQLIMRRGQLTVMVNLGIRPRPPRPGPRRPGGRLPPGAGHGSRPGRPGARRRRDHRHHPRRAAMTALEGSLVRLRAATRDDIPALVAIRQTPEVYAWWRGGEDLAAAIAEDLDEPGSTPYVIVADDRVVGWIQWQAEDEPDYRHASIDVYVDPACHGRGIGTDAVRTVARHLITDHGHHRLEIDPAADNVAAIRCYAKVGFRPVGIQRLGERGADGTWHDVLLMDLLADELKP